VTETEYPLTGELSYENITGPENAAVINSIRLWDWRPLRRTFRQLQELRSQYDFADVDIDRYLMDSEPRQVMLAGRELNINDLPREVSRDWFKHLRLYARVWRGDESCGRNSGREAEDVHPGYGPN